MNFDTVRRDIRSSFILFSLFPQKENHIHSYDDDDNDDNNSNDNHGNMLQQSNIKLCTNK